MFARTGSWLLAAAVLVAVVPIRAATEDGRFTPFTLETLDGERRSLDDVLGRKATLVVFFFPTCVYCNQAFPHVQKLYDTYREQGLNVVWINAVPREARLIAKWRAAHGYTVPILVGASVKAIDKDYRVAMTPMHYLLGPGGEILATHEGFKPGDEAALEAAVKRALE